MVGFWEYDGRMVDNSHMVGYGSLMMDMVDL